MIRNLVLKMGGTLLDIFAGVALVAVVIGSLTTMSTAGFWAGLLGLIGGLVLVVMFFYTLYLLSDIQQSVRKLADKQPTE